MAITYVGGATGVGAGSIDLAVGLTALTGGSDSAPTAGDLIIFAFNIADADNADLNLVCNTTGFAEIADLFGNGTNDANLGVFWKIHDGDTAVIGEGSTGGTDTSIQAVVQVFRGVDTTTPFDVTSTTATGTTGGTPDPPSIDWSTTGVWTVIVGANAHTANTNGTFTAPANYTTNFLTVGNQDTADGIIGMGYRTNPADPENPGTMTSSATATGWCAVTMALRPAATARVARVSWAELQVPTAPRRSQVSWAELEVPTAPRRSQVSWAELEVPTAPRRAQVSWAEFEVPDVVSAQRTAQVSWAELEIPFAPRRAHVSWAELEIPTAPRRSQVSWAELEVPTAPKRAQVSWAELQVPTAPRRALVSWAELELPSVPSRAMISWAEFEIPDAGGSPYCDGLYEWHTRETAITIDASTVEYTYPDSDFTRVDNQPFVSPGKPTRLCD